MIRKHHHFFLLVVQIITACTTKNLLCVQAYPPHSLQYQATGRSTGHNLSLPSFHPLQKMTLTQRRPKTPNLTVSRGGGENDHHTKLSMIPPATTIFDPSPMNQSILLITTANAVGFLISLLTGSHVHLDLIGTGAFALASLPTLLSSSVAVPLRVRLSSAAVFAWGAKLAGFLFFRATRIGHDGRLDDTLSSFSGTFGFWTVSLLWGILCSLPHTLGTTSSSPGSPILLTVGGVMYTLGLVTESMADLQKWNFKSSNPGSFCDVGLWSVSQHPNFFGNLLLWSGIFLMNASSLVEPTVLADPGTTGGSGGSGGILATVWSYRRIFYALASPAFMFLLFSGQANGTITNAVELANAKYGHDSRYVKYVESVPLLFPKIVPWIRQLLPWAK